MSELPIESSENNQGVLKVEKKIDVTTIEKSVSSLARPEEPNSSDFADDNALSKAIEKGTNVNNDINRDSKKLDEEMVTEILSLKLKIATLISNIRDTKTLSDKYDNENQYLQDYVGSLMKSGEIK
ncbi:uncharacterized protein AC631_02430 [Debaryomyces fabryi]|uniref:Uncharacterized protein n=1 Tax=Debaryomyces fabryi TaxID=58627 RepID=A0A0V1PZX2_9ASCO|nr:uncharacterized protein AC631_02430 [Debaryomyces fabryi]KSA01822.1 hypothetical protein AC631_02430 [Debaryomyces fabryi]CUM46748.1 unnamed protein product [Debaryomyces fabryi]